MKSDYGFDESEKLLNQLEKDVHKEYAQASKEMAEKVDAYFAKFKAEDEAQKAKYEQGAITKKEYTEWRQRKMLTGKRYVAMRDTLAKDLTNTDSIAMRMVGNKMIDTYALNMNYATYQIEHDLRVDTSFTLYNHDSVERLIKTNPAILPIPKPDKMLDYKWNKQHLQSALVQGILQGESIPKIAKRFQNVSGMDERAAIRNARTAMTGAQNGGRLDAMERAKERGIDVKKAWMATLDNRTRDSHVELDGQEQEIDDEFTNGLMFPGDPEGEPAEVYNCRCRMVHVYGKHPVDWSDTSLRNTDKLGDMTYEEWKEAHGAKFEPKEEPQEPETPKENEPIIHTESYQTLIDRIAKDNIQYREIEDLQEPLTEEQIIEKIGGGDLTKGSCSSLSYCYIGNKCGYDVTDFRGGDSQEFFSMRRNEKVIGNLDGIEKHTFIVDKEASDIAKKLKELDLPYNKEYRLMCGRHAAIIRNTENGYQYLELQSATKNGWKSFVEREKLKVKGIVDGKFEYETIKEKCSMAETLKSRFGCRVSKSKTPIWDDETGGALRDENGILVFGSEMELTAVDSYKGNAEFKDILGYLNTAPDEQKKGEKGYAK